MISPRQRGGQSRLSHMRVRDANKRGRSLLIETAARARRQETCSTLFKGNWEVPGVIYRVWQFCDK